MRGFQKVDSEIFNKDIVLPKEINKDNYNVFSPKEITIPAKNTVEVDTGLKVIFSNYDNLKIKNNLIKINHDIRDSNNYLNEYNLVLKLTNTNNEDFKINKGDVLCNVVFEEA